VQYAGQVAYVDARPLPRIMTSEPVLNGVAVAPQPRKALLAAGMTAASRVEWNPAPGGGGSTALLAAVTRLR
jgi:hypothetical protein